METIDAMIFSGDPSEETMAELEEYMARWTRGIKRHRDLNEQIEEEK